MRRLAVQQDVLAANRDLRRFAAARPTRKENVTYCGISTAEPPPVLIEQLKLTRGIGLVVDFVEPGSPAETAGLKQYDVITKLNDQLLSNSEQLGVLVRLKKPNDDANLEVIRQGKTSRINVELGQKEMDVEIEQAAADPNFQPRAFTLRGNGQLAVAPTLMGVGGGLGGGGGGGMAITNVNGINQTMWSDDQHTITLELQNGKANKMTARDNKTGNEIFNGPLETDAQRNALPPELADKLKKAEEGGPLRFAVRGNRGAPRARVLTSTEKDTLLLARFENGNATHAFAFSTTDGKTLFDGPIASDEQRKALPEAVSKQLELIEKNQDAATEFGVIGR
jgi:membrane-associated protease RseP (regulator of RpoE activity)